MRQEKEMVEGGMETHWNLLGFSCFNFCWSIIGLQFLVTAVQQSVSVIYIHMSLFFRFFSHIGDYRVLSRVSCATQLVFLVILLNTS